MDFKKRTGASDTVIRLTKEHIWDNISSIYHVEMGYETHIPRHVRNIFRHVRTETAKYVRYTPDFLVVDKNDPDNSYLLEYKSTQRPLFGDLAAWITRNVTRRPFPREDIGRCEQDAYDNYVTLSKKGIRIAVLYYVSYHRRPLLCDFIENILEIDRSDGLVGKGDGSQTPIVNFDNESMRSLPWFLNHTHGISIDTIKPYYQNAAKELLNKLPTRYKKGDPVLRQQNRET